MTFTQLEIFARVAELRGFTLAATRLNISQSAVSHAIKALEQEMGVELIHRHQAAVELTDIGAQLLLRAREILGLAETMHQEAADARGMKRGTLRIGSFGPSASMKLLPAILERYRRVYPGIEVRIDEGTDQEVISWIQERRIDVGFVTLPENNFDTFALCEDRMVALLAANHPLANAEHVSLKTLSTEPFIMTEAGSGPLLQRLFAAEKLVPDVRHRSAQLISTLAMVERGYGVSILAEQALPERHTLLPESYLIKPLNPPIARTVGLAVLDERQASPATKAFIKIAISVQAAGKTVKGYQAAQE